MVDTIEHWTDTIEKCRFAPSRRKGGQTAPLPFMHVDGQWSRRDRAIARTGEHSHASAFPHFCSECIPEINFDNVTAK